MMTKILSIFDLHKRKRVINANECKFDLQIYMPILFESFTEALHNFSNEIVFTPVESRCRGFEASLLNSKIIQSVRARFDSKHARFVKYGRFILNIGGYVILFKKLDKYNRPMNIRTKSTSNIQNQFAGNLFDESDDGSQPILYFGYHKDSFGVIKDPQLVYIDDNRVRWTITEDDIESPGAEIREIVNTQPESSVKLKLNINREKGKSV